MKKNKWGVRNTVSRAGCLGLVSAVALGATPSFAQKYTATELKPLSGGTFATANAMNNVDQVVGYADIAGGDTDAVIWNGANPTVISANAVATAINDSGVVVGDYDQGTFAWSPNFLNEKLDGHLNVQGLNGINNSGEIIGNTTAPEYGDTAGLVWANPHVTGGPSAVLNTPDGPACFAVDAINNAGVIVGTTDDCSPFYHAMRWTSSSVVGTDLGTLPDGDRSQAMSINDAGYIVGWASLPNNHNLTSQHAVIWGPTTRAFDLGTLGGKNSYATAINAEGDVAGSAQTSYGVWHATLWTHKHFTPIDLNSEIDPNLAKQITLSDAVATNNKCRVLVTGVNNKTGLAVSYLLSLSNQSNCNE